MNIAGEAGHMTIYLNGYVCECAEGNFFAQTAEEVNDYIQSDITI